MPLIENFTATQYVATPNLLVLDDTSTGSDGAVTVRYVYLQKADGSYLVEEGTTTNYEVWTLASGNTISLATNHCSCCSEFNFAKFLGYLILEDFIFIDSFILNRVITFFVFFQYGKSL